MHFYCIRRVCSVEAGTFYTDGAFEDLVSACNEVFTVVCGVVFCFDSETDVETNIRNVSRNLVFGVVIRGYRDERKPETDMFLNACGLKRNQERMWFETVPETTLETAIVGFILLIVIASHHRQ